MDRVSDISSEETEEIFSTETNGRKFDWTSLYGKLEEGEYEFILAGNNSLTIRVKFTVNASGKVSYYNLTLE